MKAEVLAPVGNREMLIAAVRSGADAVYLGAEEFSARRNAENFSKEALSEAVDYCHIRGVRVYLALNIIIKDDEMESAFDLANYAYEIGVDGVIIQDLGLAELLHKALPDLKLHASTQMSVHSPSALIPLKKMGFCQVVAAREMSRSELSLLCSKARELGMVVEVFVHGALCMSLSGQCLLSAFLGSRSGNRGLCAGPCRLPFEVKCGTGYDLSLKDLSLLDYIGELYQMGVGSFKIEGRMKRPEYVAAAVVGCRQGLDQGFVANDIKDILKGVFSRSGFTDGYYVNRLGREMFGIRTKEDVLSADGAFPLLHEKYRNERQSVEVELTFTAKRGVPITLELKGQGKKVTITGQPPQEAESRAATSETVKAALLRLGGTPYFAENVEIFLDDGLFIPQSIINALRREACEKLAETTAAGYRKTSTARFCRIENTENFRKLEKTIIARFEEAFQIPDNLDESGIAAAVYPLEKEPTLFPHIKLPKIVDIPAALASEAYAEKRLKLFKERGFSAAFCNNLAHIELCKRAGLIPLGGTGLNIANSYAAAAAKELGIEGAALSNEISEEELAKIQAPFKKGITLYGNIPLMVFRNCPLKNGISCNYCDRNGMITDRLGVEFPIRCRMGYSELLNSCPIWIMDRWSNIKGADFGILYFTRESRERAAQIIAAAAKGEAPDCKHTKGLLFRGVI